MNSQLRPKIRLNPGLLFAALLSIAIVGCAGGPRSDSADGQPGVTMDAKPTPECRDIFAAEGVRIDHLEYQTCESGNVAQLKVLKATYRVPGGRAKIVEADLIKRFGVKPLKFVCCGWESYPPGSFKDASGVYYEVQMTSGETTEKDWTKIPFFIVSVFLFLENP